jgi:probable selenium-dependent hydroxylase accessory protein YqeC
MRDPEGAYADFIVRHFRPGRVCTLVGAGGKSTGMRKVADFMTRLGIRTRLTTTTRIGADEFSAYQAATARDEEGLRRSLLSGEACMVVSQGVEGGKHAGLEPSWIERCSIPADLVLLVEGDGSRRKPIKAPTAREPVIPANTNEVLAFMGASAFGETVDSERCYNPEGVLALLGQTRAVFDTPALVMLAADAGGCRKGVMPGMGFHLIVNQGDLEQKRESARAMLRALGRGHRVAGTLLSWTEEKVYESTGD